MSVDISRFKDVFPVTTLYYMDGERATEVEIGTITSVFHLYDIRMQIAQGKLEGYFLTVKNPDETVERISISPNAQLSKWPAGFDLLSLQTRLIHLPELQEKFSVTTYKRMEQEYKNYLDYFTSPIKNDQ